MKITKFFAVILLMVTMLTGCTKDQIQQTVNTANSSGVTDAEIVEGLKSALVVGTDTSVNLTHKVDGYLKNQAIKILFPPDAQKIITTLQSNALTKYIADPYINNVVTSLNRAAEDAAIEAKPILVNAVTSITITDGKNILFGDSLAATTYLQGKTYADLKVAFKPKIQASLDKVNATKYWKDITELYNTVSTNPVNTDLTDYTTGKALDGLFYMVGGEEKDIRKNPTARVTDILQKVFGQLDKK